MAAGPRNHLFFPTNIDPNRTAKMPCVLRKQQADDKKAEIGAEEGVFSSPEGAACHAALKNLLDPAWIKTDELIVMFNTGSGLKYLDSL